VFRRFVQTERITEMDNLKLLNTQRMQRPVSPHLDIYQPQLTWLASSAHRITGVALAGVLYAGSLLYCLHPIYPSIDSAHLIASWASLPVAVKTAAKVAIAFPLSFHSLNGVRHLFWDVGKGMCLPGLFAEGRARRARGWVVCGVCAFCFKGPTADRRRRWRLPFD
jgi:succinate dehydrogenase (ubiquinone) cytochrome b560 subunit